MNKISRMLLSGFILFVMLLFSYNEAGASYRKLSIAEIAQTADIIFIGTVTGKPCRFSPKGTMIFTDVVFEDIQLIHMSGRAALHSQNKVVLTYAGGESGSYLPADL